VGSGKKTSKRIKTILNAKLDRTGGDITIGGIANAGGVYNLTRFSGGQQKVKNMIEL